MRSWCPDKLQIAPTSMKLSLLAVWPSALAGLPILLLTLFQAPEPEQLGIDRPELDDRLAVGLALFNQGHQVVDPILGNILNPFGAVHAVREGPLWMAVTVDTPTCRLSTPPVAQYEGAAEDIGWQSKSSSQSILAAPKSRCLHAFCRKESWSGSLFTIRTSHSGHVSCCANLCTYPGSPKLPQLIEFIGARAP